jgi:hypothetical protein
VSLARIAFVWLLLAAAARADENFHLRLSLTGVFVAEHQQADAPEHDISSPYYLGYADLRAVLDARRLPGRLELHLDGRVRVTEDFSTDDADVGNTQVTARGYLGGREYELRQAFVRWRGPVDVTLGRMIIPELDALKLDGARLGWRMGSHWEGQLFAGGYPDPYSRSLTTDYVDALALTGGVAAAYAYSHLWGSFGAAAAYLAGNDDGGTFDPTNPAGTPQTEPPRVWLTWSGSERALPWLDFFHDLVLDAWGAAGTTLTRLDALALVHVNHLNIKLGYDHMSSLAIDMYLTRLLLSRATFGLTNTVENHLVVERTARDQGHLTVEVTWGRLTVFTDDRIRWRSLVQAQLDPQFVDAGGNLYAPSLAYDVTLGVRDRGSLRAIRASLLGTYLYDYRSTSGIVELQVGRGFLQDRVGVEGTVLYAHSRDHDVGTPCAPNPVVTFGVQTACFGTLEGDQVELGAAATFESARHWYLYGDYRFVANLGAGAETIFTHILLLRLEYRI